MVALADARTAPPNALTDLVGSRERRLLLIGLQRVIDKQATPPAPSPTPSPTGSPASSPSPPSSPSKPSPDDTAKKLLKCLVSLSERTRHARRQQGLLGLIFTETQKQAQWRASVTEPPTYEDEELPSLTPRALEESKLKSDFWSPLRSSCWQRRELADLPTNARKIQEAGRVTPAASRTPFQAQKTRARDVSATPATSRILGPVSSPKSRRHLPGFRQQHASSMPNLTIPAPHRNPLTLEEAVSLAKETGSWPGQQISAQFAGMPGLELEPQLGGSPSSRTTGSSPGTPSKPSSLPGLSSRAQAPDLGDVDGLLRSFVSWPRKPSRDLSSGVNAQGDRLPSPSEMFPQLARRSPFPSTRMVFDGPDSGTEKVVTTQYRPKSPERIAPGLMEFDPLLAALYAEQHPPTPREVEKHPHDRHAPPWICAGTARQRLGAGSIFKVIGAGRIPQLEAGSLELRERGNYVWLASCADLKAPPRAPRAMLRALGRPAEQMDPDSARSVLDKGSKGSKAPCQVDLGKLGLTDTSLEALANSLPYLGPLEALSLSWSKLSSACLSRFLQNPSLHRYGTLLRKLDLSGNRSLAGQPLQDLSELLDSGSIGLLEELDISYVEIPSQYWTPLLQSIRNQARIKVLGLAHTQLGFWRQDPAADLAILVSEGQLQSLDISGNYFLREGFMALSSALAQTTKLTHLNLSNCVGDGMSSSVQKALVPLVSSLPRGDQVPSGQDGDAEASPTPVKKKARTQPQLPQPPYAPVLLFCEGLRWNRSLVSVNLSSCALDYAADFVLAQAIEHHPKLESLDLSGNPHGSAGLASILRASASPSSKLTRIDVTDVRTVTIRPPAREYRFDDPSDDYELNLGHPQHRALLRQLLLRHESGGKLSEFFSALSFSNMGPRFKLEDCAKLDAFGVPQVPSQGTLNFTYGAPWPATPRAGASTGAHLAKAEEWIWHGRVELSLWRCAVLTSGCFSTCLTDVQRSVFCEAFAEAFLLKAAHVALFARISPPAMGAYIVQTLLPAVRGCPSDRPMGLLGLRNKVAIYKKRDEAKLRRDATSLSLLNLQNPNGSYRLDLENPCDRAVATRLQVLSCFESEMQERWARDAGKPIVDVSQNGDFEPARNVLHEGHDILVGDDELLCFSEVTLPTSGILTLDYASRAPTVTATSTRTTPEVIEGLCSLLSSARRLSGYEIVQALRPLAHRLALGLDELRPLVQAVRSLERAGLRRRSGGGGGGGGPALLLEGGEDGSLVVNLMTILWPRCCERRQLATRQFIHNPSLVSPAEVDQLRRRLGVCATLDWQHVGDPSTNQFDSGTHQSPSPGEAGRGGDDGSPEHYLEQGQGPGTSLGGSGGLRSRNNSKSSVVSSRLGDPAPDSESNCDGVGKSALRDGCCFRLNLERHDERQVALYLFELSQREPLAAESERKNRIEQTYLDDVELDFSKKNALQAWFLELPKAGILRLAYLLESGEDFRLANYRSILAEKFLGVW